MCAMISNGINGLIPAGMRDWLPPEAGRKRDLINRLLQNISTWGYDEISSPLLEYYHIFNRKEAGTGPDNYYKLIERDGSLLVLRPEMTTPIARIIGGKLPGDPPWRLMYGEEVFRYELVQAGRQRGFHQVGVELVGESSAWADSEVLALAISSLLKAGLEKFKVSLGHMGVFNALLNSLMLNETSLEEVRRLILEKDFAGLQEFTEESTLPDKNAMHLLQYFTKSWSLKEIEQIIPSLEENIRKPFEELANIIGILDIYGYARYIQVDLSTLRSQEYYSGMVFEIYTPGIGYPIGGGGRYDNLLRQYGRDCPATGFALGIERILLSMQLLNEVPKTLLLAGETKQAAVSEKMIQKAARLREEGHKVILELQPLTKNQALKLAEKTGTELIYWQGE